MNEYVCRKDGIAFRKINDYDTEMVLSWRNSDHVRKNFIHKDIITPAEHLNWLHTIVYTGKAIQFVVYDTDSLNGKDIPFASVYFRDVDKENGSAEYGVFIGVKEYLGKGYGQKIARLMTEYGFNTLGFKKIKLRVYTDNTSAVKCYSKVGFKRVETEPLQLTSDERKVCFMEMNYCINPSRSCPVLYLVVPCYNEEEVINKSAHQLLDKLNRLESAGIVSNKSRIVFVNDGSRDNTLRMLHELAAGNEKYAVVSLSGNYGHQSAILSGMMTAKRADIVVTIDADLQQDIEALDQFIECYKNGAEVVYGIRNDRSADGAFKKLTALGYYKLMQIMGSKVIKNHADYRLVSRKVLDALAEYKETNLFLRGLIPTMGFPSDVVYFDVKEREAGQSKYTLSKMLTLAMDGITSFTARPLHMIAGLGAFVMLFSIVMIVISVIEWTQGKNVPGYTTLLVVILILFGVTLLSLGVIGEYIGKIYMETKGRPKFIIDTVVLKEDTDED